MGAIHRNPSLTEAWKLAETLSAKSRHHCYFAGLVYDALEDAVYCLASPVEARFGERGELIIPLPTIDNFPWEVEPLTDTIEPDHITLLVEGPIVEDNVREFRLPDEPSALGAPAIIDVDKHWPEWATAIRRQTEACPRRALRRSLQRSTLHRPRHASCRRGRAGSSTYTDAQAHQLLRALPLL